MNCPRCGGRLTRYRLGERKAVGCDSCSYVGVPIDHTAERGRPESWDDAIDRFQRQGQSVRTVRRADLPVDVPAADPDSEVTLGERVQIPATEDRVLPTFDAAEDWTQDADAEDRVLPTFDAAEDLVRPIFEDADAADGGAGGEH